MRETPQVYEVYASNEETKQNQTKAGGQQLYVENKKKMQNSSQNKSMQKKKGPRGNEESAKNCPKLEKAQGVKPAKATY